MSSKSARKCPCTIRCKERRESAVNVVLKKGACTSVELKAALLKEGLGESAIRKNLEFLGSKQCEKINFVGYVSLRGEKALQFRRKGRLFFKKSIQRGELRIKIMSLLAPLQRRVLEKFTKHHKDIYYFSLYELRKLLPYPGAFVNYALDRLSKLGLVKLIKIRNIKFYAEPKNAAQLRSQEKKVVLEDKIEFVVVQRVHELIMNLYPSGLIRKLGGAIRPSTEEVLRLTGGMAFDIFYQLNEQVANKQFFAIDVYTRIPVNGYVVNSFIKKIEWANAKSRTPNTYSLKDKTLGLIVFRNATPNAINIANKNGIRFLRLSDIKTTYDDVQEEAVSLLKSSAI